MVRTRDIIISVFLVLLFWKLLGVAGVMIVCFAIAFVYAKRKHKATAAAETEVISVLEEPGEEAQPEPVAAEQPETEVRSDGDSV